MTCKGRRELFLFAVTFVHLRSLVVDVKPSERRRILTCQFCFVQLSLEANLMQNRLFSITTGDQTKKLTPRVCQYKVLHKRLLDFVLKKMLENSLCSFIYSLYNNTFFLLLLLTADIV